MEIVIQLLSIRAIVIFDWLIYHERPLFAQSNVRIKCAKRMQWCVFNLLGVQSSISLTFLTDLCFEVICSLVHSRYLVL